MRASKWIILVVCLSFVACSYNQESSKGEEKLKPEAIDGYTLVWHDEFNEGSKPDTTNWGYEHGFVRNNELQWYQQDNAAIEDGRLVIEGRRERVENSSYDSTSNDWRKYRPYAEYTSSSINTRGKQEFQFGLFKIRARIDTAKGMWPAIWTLGTHPDRGWPANGEIDIMEFYRSEGEPVILANAAWTDENNQPVWDEGKVSSEHFLNQDPDWPEKFHVWKMDWTQDYIKLYLDDELINEIDLSETENPDGFNPFHQPHYILLNLAIGSNGGDPSDTQFPKRYEIDYVRIYQKE